jgi:hypothetical protein
MLRMRALESCRHQGAGHLGGARSESRQNLLRRAEGEIVQHQHDLLLVRSLALGDDQRRSEQPLLLQAVMGMHPIGAGLPQREVVLVGGSGLEQRLRDAGHAVLVHRRSQAVPMDQGGLGKPVRERQAKPISRLETQAVHPVRLAQAGDGRRAPAHLDHPALGRESQRPALQRCPGAAAERAQKGGRTPD